MRILILVEHDNQRLKSTNFHTLSAAKKMGDTIDVFIAGYHCETVIEAAKKMPDVQTLLVANAPEYEHSLAENLASLIAEYGKNYDAIVAAATTYGKNSLPRVAALLDLAMVSDVVDILGPTTFVRPIYAGNALATIINEEKIKILTIRPTAFEAAKPVENRAIKIQWVSDIIPNPLSCFVKHDLTVSARPELTDARIVVAGGRGLKSAENFQRLAEFADKLGAALGASRAAVDAGFAPNDYQVGQTGKIVAPELYIAVGISGAIQHLAGMKESKTIVAINSDPDAPIFQMADYILVGDLFQLLPELQDCLKEIKCD